MDLIEKVQEAVVNAGSSYGEDRLAAYENALKLEKKGKFLKDFSMRLILELLKDLINFQEGRWQLREMILNALSNHKVYTMNLI